MTTRTTLRIIVLVAVAGIARPADASCGTASCAFNTHWQGQGIAGQPGHRLEARYEYIRQDQPQAGRQDVGVGAVRRHHDEVETLNQNTVVTYEFSSGPDWGFTVQLPLVSRKHTHVHNHHGERLNEIWSFTEVGDAQVILRRAIARDPSGTTDFGLLAGAKFPTGRTDVRNDDGDVAERTLQPGSGTTDSLLGVYASRATTLWNRAARAYAQGLAQLPATMYDGFRPGNQYRFDVGLVYPEIGAASGLFQMNVLVRDHDRGREAEKPDSGGAQVWLSPGLSLAAGSATRLFLLVQIPVYQRVRGVQLTADWGLSAGAAVRF